MHIKESFGLLVRYHVGIPFPYACSYTFFLLLLLDDPKGWSYFCSLGHPLRPAVHVHISASRKVVLVHFSATISMNMFPVAGTLPMRKNTARWATFPHMRCPYQCNMHAHNLELVKSVKMPSDDQANSRTPQTHFHVHGNTFFFSRKCVHGKPALD